MKIAYYFELFCRKSHISFATIENHEYLIPLGYFLGDTFPDAKDYVLIGNMSEIKKMGTIYRPEAIREEWKPATYALAKPENLIEEYPMSLCLTLSEVYKRIK